MKQNSPLQSMSLTDDFRDLFPNQRIYPCHSWVMSCLLDYWFISENLLNKIDTNKLLQGLYSDHSIRKIKIDNSDPIRGKAYGYSIICYFMTRPRYLKF